MRSLSQSGATHFCNGFSASTPSLGMREFTRKIKGSHGLIRERTPLYTEYRDSLLREADRSLYLSISCFRRAHDLLIPSSSFWAHVTLYYGSWFAAHNILSLFGSWADGGTSIEVQRDAPNSQEFVFRRTKATTGSHHSFWTSYSTAMRSHQFWIDPKFALALNAINGNPSWQIEARNRVNYQSSEAFDLRKAFDASFDINNFPISLPGDIATQYEVTKATLYLAIDLSIILGIKTDVFAGSYATRAECIEQTILAKGASTLSMINYSPLAI